MAGSEVGYRTVGDFSKNDAYAVFGAWCATHSLDVLAVARVHVDL